MMKSVGYERFLKERYTKEDELFQVYDTYTPNYNKQIITNKFYSKYEVIDLSRANPDIVSNIYKAKESKPKDRKPYPETVNQSYGWFSEPLVPFDRKDSRFYFPCRQAPFITQEIRIKNDVCSKRVVGSTSLKL
ncbi:uncharacterized protein LOC123314220 [Coccinella septempunctata]|uniref:uncharacterized protein LOC123314220 n=1 Tax=Coccinella septempunctata TaxID=41139 RepID=UPI001D096DC5|nr:uncharacterized protein LOC123314220 [Coccinella septempunctata]